MPLHQETRLLRYSADQMYAVVADIESYPKFLPWCSKLVVRNRKMKGELEIVTAEMVVSYPPLRESYVSQVTLDRKGGKIEARHIEGPFEKLDTRWRFVPLAKGSEVHFLIDFAFKSRLLSALAGTAFGYVAAKMAEAFVRRADQLYGGAEGKPHIV
jgi:coenzyme Q-binding protein COQ10